MPQLLSWRESTIDSGTHSAADWTLRQWQIPVEPLKTELRLRTGRDWGVDSDLTNGEDSNRFACAALIQAGKVTRYSVVARNSFPAFCGEDAACKRNVFSEKEFSQKENFAI